jgi:hypothetical protein
MEKQNQKEMNIISASKTCDYYKISKEKELKCLLFDSRINKTLFQTPYAVSFLLMSARDTRFKQKQNYIKIENK